MNREEILQFINANPSCHLATTDGNQPRVRGMLLYKTDTTGLVFHTGAFKTLYNQITQNKHVELCFNSKDMQVRVAGIVEIIDDLNLKKEIVEAYNEIIRKYPIDREEIIIGGFSAGDVAALEIMLCHLVPVQGFVVLCPPKPESFNDENIIEAKTMGVRGTIYPLK